MLNILPPNVATADLARPNAASRLDVHVKRGYGPGPCLVEIYKLVGAAYGCQVHALPLDELGHEERLRMTPGSLAYHVPGRSPCIEVPPTTLAQARAQLGWSSPVPTPLERQHLVQRHTLQPVLIGAGWAALEDDVQDVLDAWPKLETPERVVLVMLAAAVGAKTVVHVLLQAWPQAVRQREPAPSGNSMLHYASLGGHEHCVFALLEAGAPATQKNEVDAEPKHEAARNAHTPILRRLLHASGIEGQDKFGDTMLLRLALYGPAHQPDQAIEAYRAIHAARSLNPMNTHWYSYVNRENRAGLSALDLAKLTGQHGLAREIEAGGAYHSALFRMAPAHALNQRFIYHGAQARHLLEALDGKKHGLRAGHADYMD